jgi:hypothetical protein
MITLSSLPSRGLFAKRAALQENCLPFEIMTFELRNFELGFKFLKLDNFFSVLKSFSISQSRNLNLYAFS